MPGLHPTIDPEGLQEFSVVYTDRSLNHMSKKFQKVMTDLSSSLNKVYNAQKLVIVPGGGTYAMEAVARQFAGGKKCLIVRNGWFSFRWSQILEAGQLSSSNIVIKARPQESGEQPAYAPAPIKEVVEAIRKEKPGVVFAPHVETASGMILPSDYLQQMSEAAHSVGALMVLDCIASGAIWVDMVKHGVDVLISAPQKGWSSTPCAGLAMLSERAVKAAEATTSSSYSCDLKKWMQIMDAYLAGGHAYHATMPTDGLKQFRDTVVETEKFGLDKAKAAQEELGRKVRALFAGAGFKSLAAEGYGAPGVVVSYTRDPEVQNGKKFAAQGLQIAAGVPLQCDEAPTFKTFRIGLFGLDKLQNIDRTVATLAAALKSLG